MLERVRIVLVNTSHPGNIGGVARAMKNMGLSQLVLVDPEDFPSDIAVARASGATDILAQAKVVSSLDEALEGVSLVMGTSARERHIPWPLLDPRACAEKAFDQVSQGAEVALLFGREYAGLTNEELQRCHFHIHIPSNPDYSSLNLAAAVQVLSYEVRMSWLARQAAPEPATEVDPQEAPVTAEDLERYYQHLEQVLVQIGFLDPQRPRRLMARLRRLYTRTGVTRQEMNILRGILTETQKALPRAQGQGVLPESAPE